MTDTKHDLHALADYLESRQETILNTWRDRIEKRNVDSEHMTSMSWDTFLDSIPIFLDRFFNGLRNRETSGKEVGRKHGAQRWEYNLDLREMLKEWKLLQRVIGDQVQHFLKEEALRPDALHRAEQLLSDHIQNGILYSIEEYYKLQQEESEAQYRDLQQALEQSDDLTHTHNLRGTSHDLKGIMKNLQMGFFLLEDVELNERASEVIDNMSKSADSLEQLLNDLLDLFRLETRREEVEVSEFNVGEVLRELGESLQPMAEAEQLKLHFEGETELRVSTDRKKLERVARNLILNSLKYTRRGEVAMKWKQVNDSHWQLIICDTGPGLGETHAQFLTTNTDSTEQLDYEVSERDEQPPPEVQKHGEGIGLLIVRHLCKLLKANIQIETTPDTGTEFKILLPLRLAS